MRLSGLAFITANLAVSQVAATCYGDGRSWGSDAQNVEARQKAREWCSYYGNASYGPGAQAKSCVGYSNGKIEFRIKNGYDSEQYLAADSCWPILYEFIVGCPRGGYDDTVKGWRGRADPSEACD